MTIESANSDIQLRASTGYVDVDIAYGGGFKSSTVEYRESSSDIGFITLSGQTERVEGQSRGIQIGFYDSIAPGQHPLPTPPFPNNYYCRYFTQNGDHRISHEAIGGSLTIELFNKEEAFATGKFAFFAKIDDSAPRELFVGKFDIRWVDDENY